MQNFLRVSCLFFSGVNLCMSLLSGFSVMLVSKTGFYKSKPLGFQNCVGFEPEHYGSDT